MHSYRCLAFLAIWLTITVDTSFAKKVTMYTQEKCVTKLGTASVANVPSTTQTLATIQVTWPVFVRSTATSTVTPVPSTTTVTSTTTNVVTTTNSAMTDVFTVTSTPFTTSTSTIISTSTETDTSPTTITNTITTQDSATTIPTPASGFTPLASQITANGDTGMRRRSLPTPQAGSLMARAKARKGLSMCMAKYPQSVKCKEIVENVIAQTFTVPVHKTQTVTAAPSTNTATSTLTTTSTSTVALPDVSSTVTSTAATSTAMTSTESTTTITTVTTQTQTQTVELPGATSYAACQSNNLISQVDGHTIDNGISSDYGASVSAVTETSAQDCCAYCQQLGSSCSEFFFISTGRCAYFTDSDVPSQYYLAYGGGYNSLTAGNGLNGQYVGTGTDMSLR